MRPKASGTARGRMNKRFEGQVALVSGGGAGVGEAAAHALASEGAAIVVGDRSLENASRVSMELEAQGIRALPVRLELGKHEHIAPAVRNTIDRFGRIDVLV